MYYDCYNYLQFLYRYYYFTVVLLCMYYVLINAEYGAHMLVTLFVPAMSLFIQFVKFMTHSKCFMFVCHLSTNNTDRYDRMLFRSFIQPYSI